jgi:hypothetical protein
VLYIVDTINYNLFLQALLQQQPSLAAADASLSITPAQLEERLREMLGERNPSASPSSSSSAAAAAASASSVDALSSSEARRSTNRRSRANSSDVSPQRFPAHLSFHPFILQFSAPQSVASCTSGFITNVSKKKRIISRPVESICS